MTRYTVFEDDGEEFVDSDHIGLSLQGAFQWVWAAAGTTFGLSGAGANTYWWLGTWTTPKRSHTRSAPRS
jgi:hypothetical protein